MQRISALLLCLAMICASCGSTADLKQDLAPAAAPSIPTSVVSVDDAVPTARSQSSGSAASTPVLQVTQDADPTATASLPAVAPGMPGDSSEASNVSSLVQLATSEEIRFGRGRLNQVAYGPHAEEIAVATGTGVWIYRLGQPDESKFLAYPASVTNISWAPSSLGLKLVTSAEDGQARVWEVTTGVVERTVADCDQSITNLGAEWSPDGSRLVHKCVGIYIVDAATGQRISEIDGALGASYYAWSPNGQQLAIGFNNFANENYVAGLGIWDANSGHLVRMLAADQIGMLLTSVAWSSDAKSVAGTMNPGSRVDTIEGMARWIPAEDGTIRVYDAESGILARTLTVGGEVRSVAWSPDSRRLAAAAHDVSIWDANTWESVLTLNNYDPMISLTWSPDSTRLAGGSESGAVHLWDSVTGDQIAKLEGHDSLGRKVYWSPEGASVAALDQTGSATIWDAASGDNKDSPASALILAFSPDWSSIATRVVGAQAQIRDFASEIVIADLDGIPSGGVFRNISWSPDGRWIGAHGDDLKLHVWNAESGEARVVQLDHTNTISALTWAPDNQMLATGSFDGSVRIWDLQGMSPVLVLQSEDRWIYDLEWSADETRLLAATNDGLQIWSLANAQPPRILRLTDEKNNKFRQAAWSNDGTKIAGGGSSGNIEIWNVVNGQHLLTLEGHGSRILDLVWSEDDTRLLSGSNDGTVRIWDVRGTHE